MSRPLRVVGLGGGIGAARLWKALLTRVAPTDLTLVVNTGEDLDLYGLRICPDLDTVLYALAGRQDTVRGWGLLDESWRAMDALRELGQQVWFNLGDRDLGTHLMRTGLLAAGVPLSEVTRQLAVAQGVAVRVLPMCEQPVTTRVTTEDGRDLHYQEYLVRERAQPRPVAVRYDGLELVAGPAPGVLEAIADADLVVLGPSNPVASLGTVLAVPGVREAVAAARRVVAVSSVVSRVPFDDPGEAGRARSRAALLAVLGVPATPVGIASLYADLCTTFVLDRADLEDAEAVAAHVADVRIADTMVHRGADPEALAAAVLAESQGPPATVSAGRASGQR